MRLLAEMKGEEEEDEEAGKKGEEEEVREEGVDRIGRPDGVG